MSEAEVLDPHELLHRQVVPTWRREDGSPMSCNFFPRTSDDGLLSTRQDALITPKGAYDDHIANRWQSCGTWSFTGQEADLPVLDDSEDPETPEAHASVDFRGLSRGQAERAGTRIKVAAIERGCQYGPTC